MCSALRQPVVGITCDVSESSGRPPRAECAIAYARCVVRAGGVPVLLPPVPGLEGGHARLCGAFVLTGGDDPRTEPFGSPTHPAARPVHPDRQAYETALLRLLARSHPPKPVLGVCLGMQMMALVAGGRLDQHLPDTLPTHGRHWGGEHPIIPTPPPGAGIPPTPGSPPRPPHVPLLRSPGMAHSHHRQAVADPGALAILAHSDDGVIEAIGDPDRPFYLGVQWHPERTDDPVLGMDLFRHLVRGAG